MKDLLRNVTEERYRINKDLYSYTLLRLLRSYDITILMPQEIYVDGKKEAVDMALGSNLAFDFKSSKREFEEAEYDATTKYWPVVKKAKFFITTTWSEWRIYRVTEAGLSLVEECDERKAEELLEAQIIPQLKELKIPPLPRNVEALYKLNYEELLKDLRDVFEAVKDDSRVKPLYDAYKNIMSMLYGEASEEFFTDLFIRHTYMHMAVLSSLAAALDVTGDLERVCSGAFLKIDIALPYLNWWRTALYENSLSGLLEEVLKGIAGRANLVDWSLGPAEDVFRMLYEFLIEPTTRRKIGEYYTPPWLVEMMINEFSVKEKIVLDPFCGSGTFLVKAFHKKVELGERPDDALNSIAGFDINPLAVAVARAELVMAYWRRTERIPERPPHIYHIDSLAMWFSGAFLPTPALRGLVDKAAEYLRIDSGQMKLAKASDILRTLRVLEEYLTYSIRFAYNKCKLNVECLKEEIDRYLEESLKDAKDDFVQSFLKHFKEASIANTIANILASHGGNDVWSVVLTSIYASILMARFRPDIIITNPPWIPTTEYRAPYVEKIRDYALARIRSVVGEKADDVLKGADIASAALGMSVGLAREGVAYLMNREQLFYHRSPMQAGILATYSILKDALKNIDAKVKLLDFDFDAFEHGIYPAAIIIKKGT